MSRTFAELTTDTNVAAWIPTEDFVDLVLEGIVCYGALSGNGVCALDYDMGAGKGDTVNVRTVTARTHTCANTTAGNCLSVTSNTFSEHTIDVNQQGDYDKIASFTEWKTKGNLLKQVANEMSKRLANCRDATMWTNLCGAAANTTINTTSAWAASRATDSCCNFTFDIYNAIIDAKQHLSGDCYSPDTILIHPYVAAYLYYKENGNIPPVGDIAPLVRYSADGSGLESIAGMRVVEVGVAVADDSSPSSTNDELAFVIDSSRAMGEVWGKRPDFNQFYDGKCNAIELTLWTYWGTSILDANAIVAIESP